MRRLRDVTGCLIHAGLYWFAHLGAERVGGYGGATLAGMFLGLAGLMALSAVCYLLASDGIHAAVSRGE